MLPCNPLKGQTVPSFKTKRMCVFEIIFKGCVNCSQSHKPAVIQTEYSKTVKYEEHLMNKFHLRRAKSHRKQMFVSFTGLNLNYPTLLQEKSQII